MLETRKNLSVVLRATLFEKERPKVKSPDLQRIATIILYDNAL